MKKAKIHSVTNISTLFKIASINIGVFFCLLLGACGEEKPRLTADWENEPSEIESKNNDPVKATNLVINDQSQGVRFLSYNLRNYLTMRRYEDGKVSERSKPEKEIEALIKVMVEGKPDILGVCEIGSKDDLKDLQKRLVAHGIDLPHTHHVRGYDRVRSQAILSKYPIKKHPKPERSSYLLEGKKFYISRGILDTSIQISGKNIRFLGVHFKSKRSVQEGDQEMIRRNEAYLLRRHIDQIFKTDKLAKLLAFGDFNDTKRSRTIYNVQGRTNSDTRLEILNITDSRGELWTHHWAREDIYSRIDYCMVSQSLAPHINKEACKLLDPDYWALGSDHRAMLVIIR